MILAPVPPLAPASVISIAVATTSVVIPCPAVASAVLKRGGPNDPQQVANVQAVLKAIEGIDVPPTGVYDEATEAAVKAFQKKHADIVLAPWGAHAQPTGVISLTTGKALNHVACGAPLVLTSKELARIADYNAKLSAGASGAQPGSGDAASSAAEIDYGAGDQPAAAADAGPARMMAPGGSIFHRFGAYVKRLF